MSDHADDLPKFRPEIAALPPYRQGKPAPAGGHKLSSNENPFDPLPGVIAELATAIDVNRYPDATATRLRARLGERYGVSADEVVIGAGSVSLLAAFIQAAAGRGDEVLSSWRSFEAYPMLALIAGAEHVQVPGRSDGSHNLAAIAAAVTDRTRCILICTPNNPTGPAIARPDLDAFLEVIPSDVLVLLDEAYAEFVRMDDPADGLRDRLFERHRNVVVLRTFSKAYGLAALRVGYAIGDERVLDRARSTLMPLSVTAQAEAAAIASLDHETELLERVAEIVANRDILLAGLRERGWQVPDAQGNFVWLPGAAAIIDRLDEAGIVARVFPEGVRISVGDRASVDAVLDAAGVA